MKKLVFAGLGIIVLMVTSCSRNQRADECIRCVGCFNSWTECESEWTSTEMTWEEHRDQKIAESEYSTDQCELVTE